VLPHSPHPLPTAWQLWKEWPEQFEFSTDLLVFLLESVHSCRFGSFFGNNYFERAGWVIHPLTYKPWAWLVSAPLLTEALFPPSAILPNAHSKQKQHCEQDHLDMGVHHCPRVSFQERYLRPRIPQYLSSPSQLPTTGNTLDRHIDPTSSPILVVPQPTVLPSALSISEYYLRWATIGARDRASQTIFVELASTANQSLSALLL